MNCDAVREQLGLHLDDELDPRARGAVEEHLAACPACADELNTLQDMATDLARQGPASVPDTLWASIEKRLDHASKTGSQRSASAWRFGTFRQPLAAAASVVLVVGLGVLGFVWLDGSAPKAQATIIDFGVLLDALPLDANKAFRKFLIQYDAKETTAVAARRHAPHLSFAIPATLPGGFRLEQAYTLRIGEKGGVAAAYSREGGFLATVFHAPVRQEDFGGHKDYPCVIGKHRGHKVEVGNWRLVHLTDATTCHCVLSRLDEQQELPAVMAAVAPNLPATGRTSHAH
ncbi:MAG: anti-sigma factor family protein [Phycisphaerae bacterium]